MDFLLTYFALGLVLAVPVWIVWQRVGARRGLGAMRRFDARDAEYCDIEAVALHARLLPATRTVAPVRPPKRAREPARPSAPAKAPVSARIADHTINHAGDEANR